ncbi:hypothetical protein HNQ69_001368 [Bartonella callosciuri]|uniref:Uncharacterized protein n=1 Tax=Bartonella callosciuri TaxID=686223 RepID=A0A840NT44_9HYPH|nr:hypothetical protein [Bartonella callosciuri]MBB5074231.1 hypothetical protein [Bartonella callosciuri]
MKSIPFRINQNCSFACHKRGWHLDLEKRRKNVFYERYQVPFGLAKSDGAACGKFSENQCRKV